MFKRVILVHYHEIALKGKNRIYFEKQLLKNIQTILKFNSIYYENLQRISGRICIFVQDKDIDNAFDFVSKIPGVARISSGLKCNQTLEDMILAGKKVMEEAGGNSIESFKVNARRNHTSFPVDSMELNQIIGGELSEAFPNVEVRMRDPELEVRVEVIQGSSYVYGKSIPAVGGLPVGCSGRVVSMLSSGIDSPVALWQLARRGATCIGVHFSGAPVVSDESEYLVKEIGDVLQKSGCISKIYIARIGEYQKKIAQIAPAKLRIIMYRRFMYKIAQEIAKQEKAKALVTGESLGQVASQTLENLAATDAAVNIPVFRPLIGTDKVDIINTAQKIGTFDISSEQAPDCCTLYMPKNPETYAKIKYVEQAEKHFPYSNWIPEIINNLILIEYN